MCHCDGGGAGARHQVMRADKHRTGLNDEEAALLAETAKNEAIMAGDDAEAAAAAETRQHEVDNRLSEVCVAVCSAQRGEGSMGCAAWLVL